MKLKNFIYYNAPWLIWSIFILYIMLISSDKIPSYKLKFFIPLDKVVHFGLFFILSLLVFWSWIKQRKKYLLKELLLFAIIIIVYGSLTEVLQGLTTLSRKAEWADFAANTLGCIIGLIVFILCHQFFTQINKNCPNCL